MINKKTKKVVQQLSEGSKTHESLLERRAIIANPHYISSSINLVEWTVRFAIRNPTKQVAFVSNINRDKLKYFLQYLNATEAEFEQMGDLKNLHFFNQFLDLNSNDSTEHIVSLIKNRLNKNKKLSKNGGVIVVDNLDEVVFPLNLNRVSANKAVMKNLEKLTAWHKHDRYSLMFGTVTTPVPESLSQVFGGYWDSSSTNNEEGDFESGNSNKYN
jgi:hypothetical protein